METEAPHWHQFVCQHCRLIISLGHCGWFGWCKAASLSNRDLLTPGWAAAGLVHLATHLSSRSPNEFEPLRNEADCLALMGGK